MPYKIIQGFVGHAESVEIEKYRDRTVIHERNTLGHRSIEPDSAVSHPGGYLLVTGCSITEGIALHVDELWCHLLAKRLRLPLYNLALQGTGIDVQLHNLQQWLWRYPRPKFLVRTDTEKSARFLRQASQDLMIAEGTWSQSPQHLNTVISMDDSGFFHTQYRLWQELYASDQRSVTVMLKPDWTDLAVDGFHPGPESHKIMAEDAYNQIMKQIKARR